MKIKDGFVLRTVMNEYLVMPTGANIAKYNGAVALNEVSAFLFEKMQTNVTKEELLTAVLDAYDVDEPTASADLDAIIARFTELGLME